MSNGLGNIGPLLEQLLQGQGDICGKLQDLQTQIEHLQVRLEKTEQDSNDTLGVVEELQVELEKNTKYTQQTTRSIRRISRAVEAGGNDLYSDIDKVNSRSYPRNLRPQHYVSTDNLQPKTGIPESESDDSYEQRKTPKSRHFKRPKEKRLSMGDYTMGSDSSRQDIRDIGVTEPINDEKEMEGRSSQLYQQTAPSNYMEQRIRDTQQTLLTDRVSSPSPHQPSIPSIHRPQLTKTTVTGSMPTLGLGAADASQPPFYGPSTSYQHSDQEMRNTFQQPNSGIQRSSQQQDQDIRNPKNFTQTHGNFNQEPPPGVSDNQNQNQHNQGTSTTYQLPGQINAGNQQTSETVNTNLTTDSTANPRVSTIEVKYDSCQNFLQSISLQVRDSNLMDAMTKVFRELPNRPQLPKGLYTVLLLDVSNSISQTHFNQVRRFVEKFVDDIERSAADHNLEEMIAVLTFGGRCDILQHFTNDYQPVKDSLDSVHMGGKSPLLFGLAMALAYNIKFGKRIKVNGKIINTRIVMVTDGHLTDSQEQSCVGTDFESDTIRCQSELFKFLAVMEQSNSSVSCVGVGECNKVVLQNISKRCHGNFYPLDFRSASKLGRYYLYQNPVTRIINDFSQGCSQNSVDDIMKKHTTEEYYTEADKEEILQLLKLEGIVESDHRQPPQPHQQSPQFILQQPSPQTIHQPPPPGPQSRAPQSPSEPPQTDLSNDGPSSRLEESDGETFKDYVQMYGRCYQWGTRVLRGENWKWPDDDQNTPGTVVAHAEEGVLVIKWDGGKHGTYRQENVFKITQPRIVQGSEVIEVGCSVKRGPGWSKGDEDGGPSSVGTVIRKHRNGKVSVYWPIGIVERYSYHDKKEVEVVDSIPFSGQIAEGTEEMSPNTGDPTEGEHVIWQWIDGSNGEQHTFLDENAQRLEEMFQAKAGTVIVEYNGLQFRCSPVNMKYREQGGRDRAGALMRRVCSKEEADTLIFIEKLQ